LNKICFLVCLFVVQVALCKSEKVANKECAKLGEPQIPAADRPSAIEVQSLQACNSEESYYGQGRKVDFVAARKCAIFQRDAGNDFVFGGSAILMMIYANGQGVTRNLDLALRLACEVEGAPAELDGRLEHLHNLAKLKSPTEKIDLCDDITSGFMQGFCTGKEDKKIRAKREESFQALIAAWTPDEKAALAKLRTAAEAFAEARSNDETDLSGTGRAAFSIAEKSLQMQDFQECLEKLVVKKAPKYSTEQLQSEKQILDSTYREIQSRKEMENMGGTVNKAGIQKTQDAWLDYRTQWIAFAKVKFPEYSSDSIAAWFTKKRNHMLKSLNQMHKEMNGRPE